MSRFSGQSHQPAGRVPTGSLGQTATVHLPGLPPLPPTLASAPLAQHTHAGGALSFCAEGAAIVPSAEDGPLSQGLRGSAPRQRGAVVRRGAEPVARDGYVAIGPNAYSGVTSQALAPGHHNCRGVWCTQVASTGTIQRDDRTQTRRGKNGVTSGQAACYLGSRPPHATARRSRGRATRGNSPWKVSRSRRLYIGAP